MGACGSLWVGPSCRCLAPTCCPPGPRVLPRPGPGFLRARPSPLRGPGEAGDDSSLEPTRMMSVLHSASGSGTGTRRGREWLLASAQEPLAPSVADGAGHPTLSRDEGAGRPAVSATPVRGSVCPLPHVPPCLRPLPPLGKGPFSPKGECRGPYGATVCPCRSGPLRHSRTPLPSVPQTQACSFSYQSLKGRRLRRNGLTDFTGWQPRFPVQLSGRFGVRVPMVDGLQAGAPWGGEGHGPG